jgi:hypothetical protein
MHVDAYLELRVQDLSRAHTCTFLGEHRLHGKTLLVGCCTCVSPCLLLFACLQSVILA